MKDGCIHIQVSNICDKYGYLCNGSAEKKAKCPEWGIVKAYEDSLKQMIQETCMRSKSLSEAAEEAYKELGRTK